MNNDLEKYNHISELYELKHINDGLLNQPFDYKNNILKNTLSNYIYKNDFNNEFLKKLQELLSFFINSNTLIRNWFNPTVSKYWDKHNN